jgi:hypothetical protein
LVGELYRKRKRKGQYILKRKTEAGKEERTKEAHIGIVFPLIVSLPLPRHLALDLHRNRRRPLS